MDFSELKNKSDSELTELLAEQRGQLYALRLKVNSKQLKQVHAIAAARQTIAQIQTLLTSRNAAVKP